MARKKTASEAPARAGRPSSYTQEIADEICERLANGESLRAICSGDNMPRRPAVFRWLDANDEFRDQYARACEARESELFDQIIEIADTPLLGTKSVSKATGIEITEADMIEHRRLQVEARKWTLAKLAPKKYGDKITQEHTGAMKIVTATELNDDELAAIAASGRC